MSGDLPLAPCARIIKEAGAVRVSQGATEELRDELERYASERAQEAKQVAEHAGRKTVQREDLEVTRD